MALLVLVLAGSACCDTPLGANAYLKSVGACLEALAGADPTAALQQARNAMKYDANDPLAHTAMGLTLLAGGRYAEARQSFAEAIRLDPSCTEAFHGQALAYLAEKKFKEAIDVLGRAELACDRCDDSGLSRYIKLVTGRYDQPKGPVSSGDTTRAAEALELMKKQRFGDAAAIWRSLAERTIKPGFVESGFAALTFLQAKPLLVRGRPITGKLNLPGSSPSKNEFLSGTVALRADLSKTKSVRMVAFFVNNQLAGITNQPPFQYMWDTTQVPNGTHTLKIVGTDADGFTITEKTTTVNVWNQSRVTVRDCNADPELRKMWDIVNNLLTPRPSAAAVNYNLGKCLMATGDLTEARKALELTMAMDPEYLDTRKLLTELMRGRASIGKLYRVDTDRKAIALTFDDGPTADTPAILDILREKQAKATFFVVGKQAEANPDLLRLIVAEGHEVQSHTYNHLALDFLTPSQIEQELFKTRAVLRSIAGVEAWCLRPPGGRYGGALDEVAKRYGITTIFWTANCTSLEGGRKEKMRDYIVSSARPGGIVLMHYAEGVTRRALTEAIDILRRQGYDFVTISDLLAGTANGSRQSKHKDEKAPGKEGQVRARG